MNEHTMGPWRTVPTTAHGDNHTTIRRDIVSDGTHFAPSYVAGDIMPADAKLMAAAPDLLDALRFSVSVHKAQGLYDLSEQMAVEQAEAAIAKATGS